MSIGYACLTVGVRFTNQKSCIQKNASESKLQEIITYNISSLDNIIEYNIKNNIKLFRISSDIIPFGSSPVNTLSWWSLYATQLLNIGKKIRETSMRVSMHPGQYTVLNSNNEEVVARAVEDLNYHARFLDCLNVGSEHKIVLHIGGVYNEKKQAIDRFIANFHKLNEAVKRRLVLENDDKSYNISEVLEIATILQIPVIFDNLHHALNPSPIEKSEKEWIEDCRKTWKKEDGHQKIHYSQQNVLKNNGSHSESIQISEFLDFYGKVQRNDLDIMLEVKDKNLSAVKCINCTMDNKKIKYLELEWSKYKYSVLEKSHSDYEKIRKLLKSKKEYPALAFYTLLEGALKKESNIGGSTNAAQHVWGYFKDTAIEKEKSEFMNNLEKLRSGEVNVDKIKNQLWRMAIKYQQSFLLDSYYFAI